jgi:hypothetical protein
LKFQWLKTKELQCNPLHELPSWSKSQVEGNYFKNDSKTGDRRIWV